MALVLTCQSLARRFGHRTVFENVSLSVFDGDRIGLIGPNGAGKSTLLNALMGLLPSRGNLCFDGHDISRLTLEERVMRGLALVPEKRELFGTMSVEDNLVLGGWRPLKLGARKRFVLHLRSALSELN